MSAPGDRLEGRPWTLPFRNGFYSRPERPLPAIPVALSPNKPAPPGSARCCWDDLEAQRHRPHMPASIYTGPSSRGTSLPSPPLTSYLRPSALPRDTTSRPQHDPANSDQEEACVTKTRRRLAQRPAKPRLRSTARTRLLVPTV